MPPLDWNLPEPANDNWKGAPMPSRPMLRRATPPSPLAIPPVPLPPEIMHTLLNTQAELGNLLTYLWHTGHTGETWAATRHCLDRRLRHLLVEVGGIVEPRRAAR